ncbi:glycerate kinase [Lactobacillus sp. ESL0731]|uniref:glycerate kinase family protein n=1 Tax=unclassified Lactobacillus TaxID=2620435 RepID=UPI0023F99258|nr:MULTISPECIES: glycerate kinase [unclassified Lactobacillus]WEV51198.1 glycerate kinase [Lactobacillus sp. ESL0700]WEV62328.1 glycerate kinase [Lactobacillus sp. ESL0731]
MKIVIAPDSFKGSLTAKEAALAIKQGMQPILPQAEYAIVPMADGGEGTVSALTAATNGKFIQEKVTGPLGQKVTATYGILGTSNTAVIEMAAASGMQYVTQQTHNPLIATTYGTGELITSALNQGVSQIILGIGGSATNDGGAGMAQALGYQLLDNEGHELAFGGGELAKLAKIDTSKVDPRLKQVKILIASDVTNPLVGPDGASYIFGPQKGATAEMVVKLDHNLAHYADVIRQELKVDVKNLAGAGAAGGLGAGLIAFTNSTMAKGSDIVIRFSGFKEKLKQADIVITGEGGIDYQTQFGKTPYGVALAAKEVAPDALVLALAGNIGQDVSALYENGVIDAIFATPVGAEALPEAIANAVHDVAVTAENVARLIKNLSK